MAAKTSRVSGIVVEIGGNVTGLNKALEGVNKKISRTQGNLKDVERLLKLDPKNTVLLEQKQRLLAAAVSETEEKLKTLNDANEQVKDSVKNYDAFAEAVKPVNEQIDAANKKLKELKEQKEKLEQAEDVDTEEFKKLTAAIEDTEDQLKKLKTQKKEVSAAFGDPIPQESFDNLQREIAETEAELKKLKELHKDFGNIAAQVMIAAGQEVSKYGEKVEKAGKKVTDAGMKLAPVTAAISAAGIAAVNAGSDMVESQNKVDVAFGASADRIKEFSNSTLDAYGIAKGTALDMAALYGDMATSMELPQDAAAEMSEMLVGLAGDLASFKNADLDTVQNALKGIFTGETESLKSLGIVMNQDQLLNFAMQRGMIDTAKSAEQLAEEELELQKAQLELEKSQIALNEAIKEHGAASIEARDANLDAQDAAMQLAEAEKALQENLKPSLDMLSQAELVQLRYAYVLDATQNAQGDFVRTSDGAANSMRTATEAAKEAAAGFGVLLAPVVAQAAQTITELLKAINDLPDGTKETIIQIAAFVALLGPALIVIGQVTNGVGSILKLVGALPDSISKAQKAFETISGVISGGFSAAINAVNSGLSFLLTNPMVLLIAAIVALVALIAVKGDEIQAILQKVDDFLQGIFATDWTQIFGPILGGALNNFFGVVKDVWDGVKLILDGIIDFIRGVFTGDWERAWNGVRDIFAGIFNALEGLLRPPINAVITLINAAIEGINWLIDGVNKIPGVSISTIGKIPLLANGGEVLRGSAIVGEAGPGLLTVMGDRTIVQPLTNNYTNHATNMGGISIAVYGAPGQDVRELAEIMMEEMQQIYGREEAALR